MTRIFEVALEHVRYGTNWYSKTVVARTASEAITRAESGQPTTVRAVGVRLVAEAD